MRLDSFLFERGDFDSRNKASEAIKRGEIFVCGKEVKKPSAEIKEGDRVEIKAEKKPFVSLGGYKLDKALTEFSPETAGLVFVDAGASTGGFTDCLLRRGAKRVYCVDVGENLLDKRLVLDERTVVMDKTNVRFLQKESFPEQIDAAVADCSFISLEYVLPALKGVVKDNGFVIALVKPQFELEKKVKLKGGIVRDKKLRRQVVERLFRFCEQLGFSVSGFTSAPLVEDKNVEYLFYLTNGSALSLPFDKIVQNI